MSVLTDPQSDTSKSGDSDSATTLPDTSHYQPIQPKPPASPQYESDVEDTDMEYDGMLYCSKLKILSK